MRTTLTLDQDVAVRLDRLQRDRGIPCKQAVDEALRQGLQELSRTPRRRPLHRTRTVSLGRCLIGDLDDVAEALSVAEGERLS